MSNLIERVESAFQKYREKSREEARRKKLKNELQERKTTAREEIKRSAEI